jgi:hypothetical protein
MKTLAMAALGLTAVTAQLALAGYDATRQTASFTLTEQRPAKSTGERFVFDYVNPDDPAAKPPAVQRVRTLLPKGAFYDPSVPGSCTASDAQLLLAGGAACPTESAIGGGVVTVDTGLPGPARIVTVDVEFFNNATDPTGEFIYVNTVRGTAVRTVVRADARRRSTVTEPGFIPGTLPDGGAIDTVDFDVANVSRVLDGERRNYITTPPRCPKRRHWTTRVAFTYPDGTTQTVKTPTPCDRVPASARR